LVLRLASTVLRQYLLEDVSPKLVNTLKKTEERFLSEIQFQASCHYSYLKTRGLVRGGIGHRVTDSLPQVAGHLAGTTLQPAEETEAKNKSLTLMVFSASMN
jgi:hypothetical protein